jgi:hypothetical protein
VLKKKHHFCPLEQKVSKKASFLSITPTIGLPQSTLQAIKQYFHCKTTPTEFIPEVPIVGLPILI